MTSSSGDIAETSTMSCDPTVPLRVGGAVTTGARLPLVTLIEVVAEPVELLTAVNVIDQLPAWVKPGVQENPAAVLNMLGANDAPEGSGAAVSDWIGSPS